LQTCAIGHVGTSCGRATAKADESPDVRSAGGRFGAFLCFDTPHIRVGLSVWEKPIFSRLVSLDHPETVEEGMVIALETFWPASDGWSAARIEEQMVVTKDGCEVITRFPAEELIVAGSHYRSVHGPLPGTREVESHLNREENGELILTAREGQLTSPV
jgi:Metallopeptidase family M24